MFMFLWPKKGARFDGDGDDIPSIDHHKAKKTKGETNSPGIAPSNPRNNNYREGRPICRKILLFLPCELRGPAWTVGSYSISQSAGELPKTLSSKPCDR